MQKRDFLYLGIILLVLFLTLAYYGATRKYNDLKLTSETDNFYSAIKLEECKYNEIVENKVENEGFYHLPMVIVSKKGGFIDVKFKNNLNFGGLFSIEIMPTNGENFPYDNINILVPEEPQIVKSNQVSSLFAGFTLEDDFDFKTLERSLGNFTLKIKETNKDYIVSSFSLGIKAE